MARQHKNSNLAERPIVFSLKPSTLRTLDALAGELDRSRSWLFNLILGSWVYGILDLDKMRAELERRRAESQHET